MRNLDIPTLEEDNMRTMSEWDVAELARTALAIYGIKAELEMGGGGTPEMFVDLMYGDEFVQLHYATYSYEGFCVETFDSYGDAEEHPQPHTVHHERFHGSKPRTARICCPFLRCPDTDPEHGHTHGNHERNQT